MWYRSDTSFLPLVPFREEESLRSPVFLLSESPELQILISHFPWDHTDPGDMFSSLRRAQGQESHTTIHRRCQKLSNLQELGNHQNQPTFEMLWTSWTCCCCIMLHWLKYPQASADKFLAQWSFWEIRKSKSGFECFRPVPPNCVYFTVWHNNPSHQFLIQCCKQGLKSLLSDFSC